MQARLLLEDGTLFVGRSFGSARDSVGEIIFNTGMNGYQEVLSDPSNYGKLVALTYPSIGNYGLTRDDFESTRFHLFGLIVRDYEDEQPSNWRTQYTLQEMLKEYDVPGICGIDTRQLTRIVRERGSMKAILTTSDKSEAELLAIMKSSTPASPLVSYVSTKHVYECPGVGDRIVVIDFGVKNSVLRELTKRGCDVIVVPHDATTEQVLRLKPDGVLLSNGPGDPKDVPFAAKTVAALLGKVPLFGISFGHLVLALACGADTLRMNVGHYGANYPVKQTATGRCFITTQNHGYEVDERSLAGTTLEVTHTNNNDGSVEGLRHTDGSAFSVQFYPGSSSEPFDSGALYDDFLMMIAEFKAKGPNIPNQMRYAVAREGENVLA